MAIATRTTTRLHLVDRLITDVLAWPLEEVQTEKYRDGEYVDYELGRPATRLIVEAKREVNHFSLPVGMTSLIHRLSSLTDARPGGREFKEALQQVSGYCATRGVQFAAICNGTQLVAFLGVRTDSTPPLEGSALVFTSLSAMRENFQTLWHNLGGL